MKTHATNDTYDDRLARLADAWARLIEEGSEPAARESDQVTDKICRQLANIEDVMLKLPAQGPRGIVPKLQVALTATDDNALHHPEWAEVVRSVIEDLTEQARSAAA